MQWILILTAINIINPSDKPAVLTLEYPTKEICEKSAESMKYHISIKLYKVEKQCKKNY